MKYAVHVALLKWSINRFQPVQKKAVRVYCANIYTVGQTLKTCAAREQLDQILYAVAFLVTCTSMVVKFSYFV